MPKDKVIHGFPKLGVREMQQIEALKRMPESEIDFSDIPEQSAKGWRRADPNAPGLVLQLDADVSEWLQSLGKRASTKVNSILRAAMKAG